VGDDKAQLKAVGLLVLAATSFALAAATANG
jgi:hypothetical protein